MNKLLKYLAPIAQICIYIFTTVLFSSPYAQATNLNENAIKESEGATYSCDYLNFPVPGDNPIVFAPDLISTDKDQGALEISLSGKEILYSNDGTLFYLDQDETDAWSHPARAPFLLPGELAGESCFSPSGNKIYFGSRKSIPGANGGMLTWVSNRGPEGWETPYYLGRPLYNQTVHGVSISNNQNIYASGISYYEFHEDQYSAKVSLFNGMRPFIAPDDTYIIYDKKPPGKYKSDLYIRFKTESNEWGQAYALPKAINTDASETNPFITPDGKFMFFDRHHNIYWVSTTFLDILKENR